MDEATFFPDAGGEPKVLTTAGLADEEIPVVPMADDLGIGNAGGEGEKVLEVIVLGRRLGCLLRGRLCWGCGWLWSPGGCEVGAESFDAAVEFGEPDEELLVVA
ncbi:hypothetical protein AOB60_08870 [Streptomyces noursei]|uniref:Uncharacterized protein n=1 Tax=Streptomyces noursei TaxID=1971 RepID=A0A2N8PIK4_STRNR|nr:hypothetical protein AOB60_08870 [Streptomyces noursei]